MEKQMIIKGMSCGHCKARVETALSAVSGVKSVAADPKKGTADIVLDANVADSALMDAVNALGFEAVSVSEK